MENMLEQIKYLKQKLTLAPFLEVNHSSHIWQATFEWFAPASTEQIRQVEQQLQISLPLDYITFLSECSNGGLMFHDAEYGQWGFKFYQVDELLEKQKFWQQSLPKIQPTEFLAFAEILGEANVLLLDLKKLAVDKNSCAVVEGNAIDPIDDWSVASRCFHEWLDHLIIAQGTKYWEWQ